MAVKERVALGTFGMSYISVTKLADVWQAALDFKDLRGYTPLHKTQKRDKFKARNRRKY